MVTHPNALRLPSPVYLPSRPPSNVHHNVLLDRASRSPYSTPVTVRSLLLCFSFSDDLDHASAWTSVHRLDPTLTAFPTYSDDVVWYIFTSYRCS